MQDVYKNIEDYNPNRKCKNVLILFDDMVANMISNKNLSPIVTELSIRRRKLKISVFITQSYFQVTKDVRLNCTYFFIYKNSKQIRGSTNSISAYVRYWL